MIRRRIALIAIVLCSAWALAACGSPSNDVATLRDAVDGPAATPTADAEDLSAQNEAKMMAFAACLRERGLEVEDPAMLADGGLEKPRFADGLEPDKDKLEVAYAACQHHLEGFVSEEKENDVSQDLDMYVRLATCLRERGHDIDDPTAETLAQWQSDLKDTLDWDDPDTERDYAECAGIVSGDVTDSVDGSEK